MNKDWLVLVNRLSSRMKRNAQSCRNVSFSAFHMPSIIGTTLLGSSLIDTDIQKTCCWLDCQAATSFCPPLPLHTETSCAVASGPMRLNTCTPQRRALESLVRMNRSLRTRRIEKSTNFDSTDKMRFLCGVTRSSLLS